MSATIAAMVPASPVPITFLIGFLVSLTIAFAVYEWSKSLPPGLFRFGVGAVCLGYDVSGCLALLAVTWLHTPAWLQAVFTHLIRSLFAQPLTLIAVVALAWVFFGHQPIRRGVRRWH